MSTQSNQRPVKKQSKGLEKLGVSENDVHLAERLIKQIPSCPSDPNKAERILGYATSRLEREKALRLLGTTEEEVEIENAKNLGSLGVAARRRSHSLIDTPPKPMYFNKKPLVKRGYKHHGSFDTVMRQRKRKTSAELHRLRNQSIASANEIEALKKRIYELESLVQRSASLGSNQTNESSRNSSIRIVEELN
jgi:hypothetical protein